MDFESGPDFEEHVIVHLLQDDGGESGANGQSENVIDISSDNDEDAEDNAFLYAVEVTSMGGDEVSECDLPSPIKKMLSQESLNLDDEDMSFSSDAIDDDDDDSSDQDITFPCKGLRNQALHQYSEPDKCCQLCPAYFATIFELEQHRMIHTMSSTVECPHCYEVFSSAFKLHQHIRTRRKKAPKLRKNGAKKKCNETNRDGDSKSQSETSVINVDTDEERKSGAKTKSSSSTSNERNSHKPKQGNRVSQMQATNNCKTTTPSGEKILCDANAPVGETGVNTPTTTQNLNRMLPTAAAEDWISDIWTVECIGIPNSCQTTWPPT